MAVVVANWQQSVHQTMHTSHELLRADDHLAPLPSTHSPLLIVWTRTGLRTLSFLGGQAARRTGDPSNFVFLLEASVPQMSRTPPVWGFAQCLGFFFFILPSDFLALIFVCLRSRQSSTKCTLCAWVSGVRDCLCGREYWVPSMSCSGYWSLP